MAAIRQLLRDDPDISAPFSMAFQPIIHAATGKVFAHEALVRGLNGEGAREVISRIAPHRRYLFDQQCRLKAITMAQRLHLAKDGAYLSINIIPNAVYAPQAGIGETLAAAEAIGFPINQIILEFTEHESFDAPQLLNILAAYRNLGFKTAIDDFGSGHSGLSLLSRFQPDIVKLDMSLIRDIDIVPVKRAIIQHMVRLLDERGIVSLAEGVETEEEFSTLRELGVCLIQGFLIARPNFEALSGPAWRPRQDSNLQPSA